MSHGAQRLITRCVATSSRRPSHRQALLRWSSTASNSTRKWSTPLAKNIADAIETTGPISIAAYMRQCLTSSHGGYYTAKGKDGQEDADQFGTKGDFITSPEISQMFGEMVGLWLVSEWIAQTARQSIVREPRCERAPNQNFQLVELGPGRGTLMEDVLRTIKTFKGMFPYLKSVYLVETSEALRQKQHTLLCGKEGKMASTTRGWTSFSSKYQTHIHWVEDASRLPWTADRDPLNAPADGGIPFIIAHEFFDALPIHAFESVAPNPNLVPDNQSILDASGPPLVRTSSAAKEPQWREYLVSPTKLSTNVARTTAFPASATQSLPPPDFQLTLARASTPTSLVLPSSSSRYAALKSRPGSCIEISSDSQHIARSLARVIGGKASATSPQPAGAALIIDYGPASTIPTNSLRGIYRHARVSPFVLPGRVDLSVDVDFTALADAALEASPRVEVYGPVEQGSWLQQLGIRERAEQLGRARRAAGVQGDEAEREWQIGWQRLIDRGPNGMGRIYQVMAVVPESGGKRRPVGFGGGVVDN